MQAAPSPRTDRLVKTKTPGIYTKGNRYVVVFRDVTGRQRKRSARTLAAARDLKATLTADVKRGEYRELSRVIFRDYACEWIDTYNGRTRRGLREQTRADYRRAIERAIDHFGAIRLAAIEPRDVRRFAAEVAKSGVSQNTVRLAVAPLKALLATAVEDGLIRSNPAAGVRLPRAEKERKEVQALTPEQLAALLAEVPEEWRLLVEFLAGTGLRISEALALTWGDVDFGRRRVRVQRRRYRGSLDDTKSEYGRRDVPLSHGLSRALWRARGTEQESALVFSGRDGRALDSGQPYRVVKSAGTCFAFHPDRNANVAHVCLSVWSPAHGTPALFRGFTGDRHVRSGQGGNCSSPLTVGSGRAFGRVLGTA